MDRERIANKADSHKTVAPRRVEVADP